MQVYVEQGSKRAFAGAVEWPGWCRHGPDEAAALEALLAYGPKYARVLNGTRLGFTAPRRREELSVVERLRGDATTDFGAPGQAPSADRPRLVDQAEVQRFETILRAGWRAFDRAVEEARGKPLATGPRGGGRSLEKIVAHVIEADAAYLGGVGWKAPKVQGTEARLAAIRKAILDALRASARGEIPARGPRGGQRWTARYFVRRVAWHVISHAWEIERRVEAGAR